jgi:hypothetical protein
MNIHSVPAFHRSECALLSGSGLAKPRVWSFWNKLRWLLFG